MAALDPTGHMPVWQSRAARMSTPQALVFISRGDGRILSRTGGKSGAVLEMACTPAFHRRKPWTTSGGASPVLPAGFAGRLPDTPAGLPASCSQTPDRAVASSSDLCGLQGLRRQNPMEVALPPAPKRDVPRHRLPAHGWAKACRVQNSARSRRFSFPSRPMDHQALASFGQLGGTASGIFESRGTRLSTPCSPTWPTLYESMTAA